MAGQPYAGLRSGEVAEAAGVNQQTLRYYERRGLLAEPERTLGGHRLYRSEVVTLVRVIKVAQSLGFSLEEVAELLEAGHHHHERPQQARQRPDRRHSDADLQQRARAKLAEVEAKIADLGVIAETLRAAIRAGCDDLITCAATPSCPLPFADLAGTGHRDPGA
ncbi:MerR family transcriptional regulator [Nonomuraea sp. SBT364]|uniref:MerR family transcriptional regulator n=1 Tax=Nonomuraea sp. SBT364 TaxID=1580530 RepID=UPI00066ABC61|nr:MerR family transcriptional regulator [Nonomuraea sp. SBT364]